MNENENESRQKWYKVLKEGRSFCGGTLTWSLPRNGKPGEWHAVEWPLVPCRNGLHLTSEPTYLHAEKTTCYEAEFDGEHLKSSNCELVVRRCRLLRRVPWPELKVKDADGAEPVESAALHLLRHTWKHVSSAKDGTCSWRLLNDAMQRSLALAIESGMRFDIGDFRAIGEEFNAGFWLSIENSYRRACDGSHGPNASAYRAIEHHLGRKPFIVATRAVAKAPKVRLHVGARFDWHVDLKERVCVTVTSFAADQSHVVACSYKEHDDNGDPRKVDRLFKITHADIAAYHAAIRAAERKPETEEAASS